MYYYTYYTYEEFGRGYIGSRQSKVPPEQDPYMGSYKDKTFKPTHKIILQAYKTREEAMNDEIKLHDFYEVDINPHFANKARARSEKFYFSDPELSSKLGQKCRDEKKGLFSLSHDQIVENARKGAKIAIDLGVGIHGMTFEERSVVGKKGAQKAKELNVGIVTLTKEQLSLQGKKGGKVRVQQLIAEGFYSSEKQKERGKKGGRKIVDLGVGIHSMSSEERSALGKKGGEINKKNKSGICGLTKEQRSENARILALQKWQCTVTGFISTVQGLAVYQKNRGIDTSKRIKLS
jgi:hypothetical protein